MTYTTFIPNIPGFANTMAEVEKIDRLTQALLKIGVSADEIQRIKADTSSPLSTADRLQQRLENG